MVTVDIKNWKTLSNQFGLVRSGTLRSAIEISKELTKFVNAQPSVPEYVFVECNPEASEAICIFQLVTRQAKIIYEYQGTAN